MENNVFTKIKRRLLSTTSKSSSYFVGKVENSKSLIDLVDYFDMYCPNKLNISNKSETIKITPLKITNDYFDELDISKISEVEFKKIKLNKYITEKEFISLKELSEKLLEEKDKKGKDELKSKYKERLARIKSKCLDNITKEYTRFNQLYTANKMQIRDMGQDNLYLGYPFIEGKFSNKKAFRAPLVLHQAKLTYSNNQVTIKLTGESYINQVFLISNAIENNVTDFDVHDGELRSDYLEHALEILEQNGIIVEKARYKSLNVFDSMSKTEFTEKVEGDQINRFTIKNNVLLGLFNITDNNIYFDIEKMERLSNVRNFNKKLYGENISIDDKVVTVDETKLKYISNLDNSQKRILTRSLSDNLVIEGPPGTGKSQVLTNIIANEVFKGKKVLVVSEKVGAISVIKDRLRSLKEYALIVSNKDDKNLFYDQLKDFEKIIKQNNLTTFESKEIDSGLVAGFSKFENKISKVSVGKFKFNDIVNFSQDERYLDQEIRDLLRKSDLNLDHLEHAFVLYTADKDIAEEEVTKILLENDKPIYKKLRPSKLTLLKKHYEELKEINKPKILKKELSEILFPSNKGIFKGKLDDREKELIDELAECFSSLDVNAYNNDNLNNLKLYKRLMELGVNNFDDFKNYILHNEFKATFAYIKSSAQNFIEFTNISEKISKLYDYKSVHNDIEIGKYLHDKTKRNIEQNYKLEKAFKEVIRLNTLKARRSIKYVIDKTPEIIDLFSVVLLTPNMVSTLLPLFEDMFDCVVFDESSQLFVEKAIPSIYRSKKVIIAGDSKQLQPSNYFSARIDDSEEELDSDDDDFMLKSESLLDFGKGIYKQDMLNYHYRSNYKELIEFSSEKFYDNGLKFASVKDKVIPKPVEVVNVDGKWVSNVNKEEANKVVEIVKYILKTRKNNETIGIIAFNKKQASYINNLLIETSDPMILTEMDRMNEQSREPEFLFVKNIENVQGDERDIIIMSIGYGGNVKSFGPLSQSSGENRLNVAITRAKQKIFLIKSFMGKDLLVNNENEGPKMFKEYLMYCDNIASAKGDSLNNFSLDMEYTDITNVIEKRFSDYYIDYNENIGSFIFDVVIKDNKENPLVCLMILKSYGVDFQDLIAKYIYLKSRGWKVYIIFDVSWIVNKEGVLNSISNLVHSAKNDTLNSTFDNKYLDITNIKANNTSHDNITDESELFFDLSDELKPKFVSFEEHYKKNIDFYSSKYKYVKNFSIDSAYNCLNEDLLRRNILLILIVTLNKYNIVDRVYIHDLDDIYVNELSNLKEISIQKLYNYAIKSYNNTEIIKELENDKELETNVKNIVVHIKRNIHQVLKEIVRVSKRLECGKRFISRTDYIYAHIDLVGDGSLIFIDLSKTPKIDSFIISKAMFIKMNSVNPIKSLCYVNPLYGIFETIKLD